MLTGMKFVRYADGRLTLFIATLNSGGPGPMQDGILDITPTTRKTAGACFSLNQVGPSGRFRRLWEVCNYTFAHRFCLVRDLAGLVFLFSIKSLDQSLGSPASLNGGMVCSHQTAPNGAWANWQWSDDIDLSGHDLTEVSAALGRDGLICLFVIGADRTVYVSKQISSGDHQFTAWQPLGGQNRRQIVASTSGDGFAQAFVLNVDGSVEWIQETESGWTEWKTLGGTKIQQISVARWAAASNPRAAVPGSSRVSGGFSTAVFALGGDGTAYVNPWTEDGLAFLGWRPLGNSNLQQIVGATNADGRFELFALGGDGAILHVWTDSNNVWGSWQSLGGVAIKQFAVGVGSDGRLGVAAAIDTGVTSFQYIEQTGPNNDWGVWVNLPYAPGTYNASADGSFSPFVPDPPSDTKIVDNRT